MSIFKRKKHTNPTQSYRKEEIFKQIFADMAQKPASEHFATGAIFDIIRQQHDVFEKSLQDVGSLSEFFVKAYILFLQSPELVGFNRAMVNAANNDTDPLMWNEDIFELENGDAVALYYMPITNNTLEARIFGIVVSDSGDGYYYCMLNKSDEAPSIIIRNQGMSGIGQVGKITGRGFELMNDFKNFIVNDFYKRMR